MVDKYLSTYAILPGGVPEIQGDWEHVLVVPCFDESADFLNCLAAAQGDVSLLLVLVVNTPESADARCNQVIRKYLAQHLTQPLQTGYQLHQLGQELTALSIDLDALEGPTPSAEGVGRARRVGCDTALALIKQGVIKSRWIYSGDADAGWASGFFDSDWPAQYSAICLPFTHGAAGDPAVVVATLIYELKLHHYVLHLQRSGSPYAFHALGSSCAFNSSAYAAVRGVPLRSAGEDFYLLNKLAKVGPVHAARGCGVTLESRRSDRAPFGTGPAVSELLAAEHPSDVPIFYDAKCFSVLSTLLERFNQWILKPELDPECDLLDRLEARVANDLTELLTQWRYQRAIEHIQRAAAAPEARQKHANTWLDGFKLLKIIHLLRDRHYPNLTFQASAASQEQWPIELPSQSPTQIRQAIYEHLGWWS